jgi:hypothetical protein
MKKIEKEKLNKILESYFKDIHNIYITGSFREESFYSSLKTLVEECYKLFGLKYKTGVIVQPKQTEVGIPDFLIRKDGEIIGYFEAKTPDENLRDIEDSEQLKRHRRSLPNLILTNFLEFWLYRYGNLIEKVEVGRQFTLQKLEYPPAPLNLEEFHQFLEEFFSFSIPEIQKSSELSIELAKRTRFLEHILQEELLRENEEVIRFYKAFQEELIETLTKERFADLYAQTITYGLFAARMRALTKKEFERELAWKSIPKSLPLLREIFYSLTGPHFPESLTWLVDDISQVLKKADIQSILKEFKITRWEEDPVIHFYETFLATYNPEERERLGVYYTPLPVISYITRSIHKILKEKFGKSKGLATRDVNLLDPAAGTLTFVVQAIKQVQKELEARNKKGLIKLYIEEHIIPHFYAFEILMAPYTVGHFKVSMILEEMGYKFKEDERFKFYLTNTLEMKEPKQTSFLIDLAKEGLEAKKVKKEIPILVILGNPPYSVSSENKSEFIEGLMNDYKEDVRGERNIQPLSDDYIKFIRFAHWKIDQTSKGILGFVTNNSYLSGIIHRGIRKKLLETFDEIYILNLHGSSRIGEKTPEGGKDENVFDIQQGVTIAIYVKNEKLQKDKKIYYADLWGLREEKYKYLFENDIQTTKWQELEPLEPYYFFVPKDFALKDEYEKFWKLTEIFRDFRIGLMTGQDKFFVDTNPQTLKVRILSLFNKNLSDEKLEVLYELKSQAGEKTIKARKLTSFNQNLIRLYCYRPFDIRYVYAENKFLWRSVETLSKHFIFENPALVTTRILAKPPFNHVFVAQHAGDNTFISSNTKERTYFFPLYLYPNEPVEAIHELPLQNTSQQQYIPNFTTEFLQAIRESLSTELNPEEIFNYIYAVLYSPTYRKRYEEFLKIDFPRIPLPTDYRIFKTLSNLGKELIKLHLLKHQSLSETEIGFPQSDFNKVTKVNYDEKTQRVYINKNQYFEGISNKIWQYKIGAYQVMYKYLKDRKTRKLSLDEINHYMKIAKSISLTIELQEKIDKVYKKITF